MIEFKFYHFLIERRLIMKKKFYNCSYISEIMKVDPLDYIKELGLEETLFSKNGYKSKILEINGLNVMFFDTDREIIDTGRIIEEEDDDIYIKRSDGEVICWPK